MYVAPAFKTDDATALAFAAERGFGTFIAVDDGRPVASHLPFELITTDTGNKAIFHVARANPLHQIIGRAPDVLLTVLGPDHYISPDWYRAADQVPTWNYVSVHLSGIARALDRSDNLALVDRLSARFEGDLLPKKPWVSSKMTPSKRDAMLAAIVGIELTVTKIEASTKLSQNKTTADQDGAIAAIGAIAAPASRGFAAYWNSWRANK